MTTALSIVSICFAFFALAISAWGRYETYQTTVRQRDVEQAKRIGEALLSAQILKNTLDKHIKALSLVTEQIINTDNYKLIKQSFEKALETSKEHYNSIWEYVKLFEEASMLVENGMMTKLKPARMEATIARFKQMKELALIDIEFANEFYETKLKPPDAV